MSEPTPDRPSRRLFLKTAVFAIAGVVAIEKSGIIHGPLGVFDNMTLPDAPAPSPVSKSDPFETLASYHSTVNPENDFGHTHKVRVATKLFEQYVATRGNIDETVELAAGKNDPASLRLTGWKEMLEIARKIKEPAVKALAISSWIGAVIQYDDNENAIRQQVEKNSVQKTLSSGLAVCANHSILMYESLLRAGVDKKNVKVIDIDTGSATGSHAAVALKSNDRQFMYDVNAPKGQRLTLAADYFKIGTFDISLKPLMAFGVEQTIYYENFQRPPDHVAAQKPLKPFDRQDLAQDLAYVDQIGKSLEKMQAAMNGMQTSSPISATRPLLSRAPGS